MQDGDYQTGTLILTLKAAAVNSVRQQVVQTNHKKIQQNTLLVFAFQNERFLISRMAFFCYCCPKQLHFTVTIRVHTV